MKYLGVQIGNKLDFKEHLAMKKIAKKNLEQTTRVLWLFGVFLDPYIFVF
jgi:hypothetical protein